jgi:hypothetical protein
MFVAAIRLDFQVLSYEWPRYVCVPFPGKATRFLASILTVVDWRMRMVCGEPAGNLCNHTREHVFPKKFGL